MVVVSVRETYDLHTTKNKMTVIGIHTPKPDIIKRNYPGLLMQCRAYRPVSCDVKIACASMLPLDPQGVGTDTGDVAPEDVFNPILYKAMSNKGMSQFEARIQNLSRVAGPTIDVNGSGAFVDVDDVTTAADEFDVYYGLLADTHSWKHASPQAGLEMRDLRPLVYEMVYNIGDQAISGTSGVSMASVDNTGLKQLLSAQCILGAAKPMPFINCTSYTLEDSSKEGEKSTIGYTNVGFPTSAGALVNASMDVPYLPVNVAAIVVPPSKLHELFYRMVVVWRIEFSQIRSVMEIADLPGGIAAVGSAQHYQNYSYAKVKEVLTGSSDTILENDSCMVSANVDVNKVM